MIEAGGVVASCGIVEVFDLCRGVSVSFILREVGPEFMCVCAMTRIMLEVIPSVHAYTSVYSTWYAE